MSPARNKSAPSKDGEGPSGRVGGPGPEHKHGARTGQYAAQAWCSRRGIELGPSFPEVAAGAVRLPEATALDGELVVWDATDRLAFERLQNRLARRGAGAVWAAEE